MYPLISTFVSGFKSCVWFPYKVKQNENFSRKIKYESDGFTSEWSIPGCITIVHSLSCEKKLWLFDLINSKDSKSTFCLFTRHKILGNTLKPLWDLFLPSETLFYLLCIALQQYYWWLKFRCASCTAWLCQYLSILAIFLWISWTGVKCNYIFHF